MSYLSDGQIAVSSSKASDLIRVEVPLGERAYSVLIGPGTRHELAAVLDDHVAAASELGFELEHFQSNHEGDLIDSIGDARGRVDAIIINAGAFTHYAWALHDALAAFDGLVIELHLSNPSERESWRHLSVVEPQATAVIVGLGADGYPAAVSAAVIDDISTRFRCDVAGVC